MIRARGAMLVCLVAAFALRAGFALVYWTDKPLTHDEREYLALARSLARGDGYHYPADEPRPGTGQQFGRAPGYPAFLSTVIDPVPAEHVPRRVQIVQALIGTAGVLFIGLIATRAAGPRAGTAAAALAAIYPPLVWMPAYALSETLFSSVALGIAYLLAEKGDSPLFPKPDTKKGAVPFFKKGAVPFFAGLAGGAGILIRPALLFFLPFAACWMIVRRAYVGALLFLVAAALVVTPWMARNHQVYGRWMIASEGGVTFWTGNHPLAIGEGDLAANPDLKQAEIAFRAAHPGLTPEQLEPLYYRDALAWIAAHPAAWLRLMARKVFYTVVPIGPSYAVHSSRYVVASVVSYGLVLAAAVAGVIRSRRTARRASVAPLWLMAASTVLAGLVFFPQERFRLPIIDPALIVTAALLAGAGAREIGAAAVAGARAGEAGAKPAH